MACCENRLCSHNKMEIIIGSISETGAFDTSNQLNMNSQYMCPYCNGKMSFFPFTSQKDNAELDIEQ